MLFDSPCVTCSREVGPVCQQCEGRLVGCRISTVAGVDRCISAYDLDERSRQIIAALKYRKQRRLAAWLATRLAPLVPRGADALTWLPAAPSRKRQRGFDQAQELTRALAALTDVPAIGLLSRARNDHQQTGRSRSERLSGPDLRIVRPSPEFIVLIDDVMTTGSSLRAAAQQLRHAGATRVVAVTVAATPSQKVASNHASAEGCSVRRWT